MTKEEKIAKLAKWLKGRAEQEKVAEEAKGTDKEEVEKVVEKVVDRLEIVDKKDKDAGKKDKDKDKDKGKKDKGKKGNTLRERIEAIKVKVGMLRGKKAEVSDVVEGGDTDLNIDTMDKDYSMPVAKPDFADKGDLSKSKNDAIDQLPPTMLAEDVRAAYKKAIKLAWNKTLKNLEPHVIKSSLYDHMIQYGIKHKVAVALIESAFENAGARYIDELLKRAEEIVAYSPEAVADMENEIQLTCVMMPSKDVHEVEEDMPEDEEMEDRVVEGSFKIPKSSAKGTDLLSKAVSKYIDMQ